MTAERPDLSTAGQPQAPEFWRQPAIIEAIESQHAGKVLLAYRAAFEPKVSQVRLAAQLGISQPTLSKVENQALAPDDHEDLIRLFTALQVPLDMWWFPGRLTPVDLRPPRKRRSPPSSTTLYRFFDAEDALLYVGITHVGTDRWKGHSKDKDWWPQVVTIKVEHHETREMAMAAEAQAIRAEHPRHNIALAMTAPSMRPMRPLWIPPEEIIKTADVSQVLGIALRSVSVYRRNYPDFPEPLGTDGESRLLWWRPDIEWFKSVHKSHDKSRRRSRAG